MVKILKLFEILYSRYFLPGVHIKLVLMLNICSLCMNDFDWGIETREYAI